MNRSIFSVMGMGEPCPPKEIFEFGSEPDMDPDIWAEMSIPPMDGENGEPIAIVGFDAGRHIVRASHNVSAGKDRDSFWRIPCSRQGIQEAIWAAQRASERIGAAEEREKIRQRIFGARKEGEGE